MLARIFVADQTDDEKAKGLVSFKDVPTVENGRVFDRAATVDTNCYWYPVNDHGKALDSQQMLYPDENGGLAYWYNVAFAGESIDSQWWLRARDWRDAYALANIPSPDAPSS